MAYKIMQKASNTATTEYWSFIKVDSTSSTDYTATTTDDLEIKLKELLKEVPITQLKVISETSFTDDLIFS
jgi:hypothetical protein